MPFCPWTATKDTCWPSCRLLKPEDWMELKWTKRSGPLCGVMNPKPLASLNHFTVPVCLSDILFLPGAKVDGRTRAAEAGCKEEAGNRCSGNQSTTSGHVSM